jgi:hypothetical protein
MRYSHLISQYMCRIRVDIHDSETGFIVFRDMENSEQAQSLKGSYTGEEVLGGENEDLSELLKECMTVKGVSHVLQHLDQGNVTVTVTVTDDPPSG